ncbi:MAG: alcohol dehydrogenase catalytic domain-containing protein [Clostridiales Family XIII bacterium]|jgi:(R,R)-butanediol dehydrogenase/meso-butanediol dehydrogenase/diacetyl reductase/L-iditol 2-dehydrogenase|nr:alcohol dehydrogenase catalytic domain-containing protein [Clostridiales Family XIII bacterium]
MKQVTAVRVGNMKDPDPEKRGLVEVTDVPVKKPGPGEVLIKVAYCAICGSDPHVIGGLFGWDAPFGIGHELSGVVAEVGPGLKTGIKVGDRVGGNFRNYCGSCYYCTNGLEQWCENATEEPGMAEYVLWNEKQCVVLPGDVSLKNGCLIEPVSVAVRVMDKTHIKIGQNVVVSGGGPIGLLNLQLANLYGAANLTLLEPNPARRELAKKYGAKYVFDPLTDDIRAETARITNGRGFDVLLEVSGIPSAAELLLGIAAKSARVIYVAQYARGYNLPLNLYDQIYMKELEITGTFVSPYTFTRTAQIIGRLDLDDLTAQVFPIDEAKAAFEAHLSGKYPKIIVQCSPDMD